MLMLLLSMAWFSMAQFPLNTALPEQYACVLASDQYVPAQNPPSPFMGILYLTVTPLVVNSTNPANNQFRVDTFLYHNVDYATQAYICGPAARGKVNGSTCIIPLYLAPDTPTASSCPLYSHMTVYQDVIDLLRDGELFATVTSGGQTSGQLRGQIENRNDIFFVPIVNKNSTKIVGASLLRLFDIQGYTFVDVTGPAGVEIYLISAPDYNNDDISGFSVLTNLSALAFGNLVVTNSVANTIFFAALTLPVRQNLEKRGTPVYGFNSSNMLLYAQDFSLPLVNDTAPIPTYLLGEYIRLPFMKFVGNDVLVFTQTGSSFGGGGTSESIRPTPVVAMVYITAVLITTINLIFY